VPCRLSDASTFAPIAFASRIAICRSSVAQLRLRGLGQPHVRWAEGGRVDAQLAHRLIERIADEAQEAAIMLREADRTTRRSGRNLSVRKPHVVRGLDARSWPMDGIQALG
jgi:hypothetical protein